MATVCWRLMTSDSCCLSLPSSISLKTARSASGHSPVNRSHKHFQNLQLRRRVHTYCTWKSLSHCTFVKYGWALKQWCGNRSSSEGSVSFCRTQNYVPRIRIQIWTSLTSLNPPPSSLIPPNSHKTPSFSHLISPPFSFLYSHPTPLTSNPSSLIPFP